MVESSPAEMRRQPFQRGLVQVYTGNGKGKTTAALGLALRAAGYGLRTKVIQFLKGVPYGELSSVSGVPSITIEQFGTKEWLHPQSIREEDRRRAREAMRRAREVVARGEANIVVLDEVNLALDWKMLPAAEVLDLMATKPDAIELVLTGRSCPAEIMAAADLVTEMHEVKHPYQRGIDARGGIEF